MCCWATLLASATVAQLALAATNAPKDSVRHVHAAEGGWMGGWFCACPCLCVCFLSASWSVLAPELCGGDNRGTASTEPPRHSPSRGSLLGTSLQKLFGGVCCRICQNDFNNELSLLELGVDDTLVARVAFDGWARNVQPPTAFLQKDMVR
jgi:hypothetical protein